MYDEDAIYRIIELIDGMLDSIQIIQERVSGIKSANDFLISPDNMFILDGICMKLIFIGESIKTIDKLSKGELFPLYPAIPWKEIMKLRDIIAHHYFKIDVDIVYSTIKEDLSPLENTLRQLKDYEERRCSATNLRNQLYPLQRFACSAVYSSCF